MILLSVTFIRAADGRYNASFVVDVPERLLPQILGVAGWM
jgi:hypothetical protein